MREKGLVEGMYHTETTKKIHEKLDNPPDMGKIKGKLSREEIYEENIIEMCIYTTKSVFS
ncbi:hypothetical protein [Candidatus Bathycorpusculum sp.]|jgi:hypothetical protein|uniref:hypothetical protein n=1 Tax=Candidatus Bathycorpusculum sp. TaxID=2994959 RepID=UPI00282115CE|nr:hypothetical protein [Candidatus Termitimicrobium sp.]MCL2686709.1 hypothetical protein [Candidatus Termitimicrobium sp.]